MRKDISLPAAAVVGGAVGFLLRSWELRTAFDPASQLFIPGTLPTLLLGVLTVVMAALFALVVWRARPSQDYSAAFRCPSPAYMALMTCGGLLMAGSALLGLREFARQLELWRIQPESYEFPAVVLLCAALAVPGGLCGVLLGRCHYRGLSQGSEICAAVPGYAVLAWLVLSYQEYSRDPVLERYALHTVGVVCTVLAFYYAAAYAFRRPRPRRLLFLQLAAIYLDLTTLADAQSLFVMALTGGAALMMLGQCSALLRAAFGPPWPEEKPDLDDGDTQENTVREDAP